MNQEVVSKQIGSWIWPTAFVASLLFVAMLIALVGEAHKREALDRAQHAQSVQNKYDIDGLKKRDAELDARITAIEKELGVVEVDR